MSSTKTSSGSGKKKQNKAHSSGSGEHSSSPWRGTPLLPIFPELWDHHAVTLRPLLKDWRDSDRIPPVLLLTGPQGIGKQRVVAHLAQTLFCHRTAFQSPPEERSIDFFQTPDSSVSTGSASHSLEPCGECPACQKALSHNWVDYLEIAHDAEDGEKGTLKIEQFRALKERQGYSGFDGEHFIVHIKDADRMTIPAANSLLKILEEPPRGWIFFLTAPDPSLVLPTILSRCQRLRLKPLPIPTVEALLTRLEAPADRRAACARESQGSIERAILLAQDDPWHQRSEISSFLRDPAHHFAPLLEWAVQSQENLELLMDRLEQELHAQLLSPQSIEPLHLEFLLGRFERVNRLRVESLAPLNRKILVQDLLSPWLGAPRS